MGAYEGIKVRGKEVDEEDLQRIVRIINEDFENLTEEDFNKIMNATIIRPGSARSWLGPRDQDLLRRKWEKRKMRTEPKISTKKKSIWSRIFGKWLTRFYNFVECKI